MRCASKGQPRLKMDVGRRRAAAYIETCSSAGTDSKQDMSSKIDGTRDVLHFLQIRPFY